MADEFVAGQIGRWRSLNGFRSVAQCVSELRARCIERGLGRRTDPLAHVTARMSGMGIHDYVRLHTMLPFAAFAADDGCIVDHGWTAAVARYRGTVTPRKVAYFCPACAAEDRDFWGYSYWRRTHQLPGMLWCQKHPEERLHAVAATAAFSQQPHIWLDRVQTVVHRFPIATRDHVAVRRFVDICQAMLDHGRPCGVRDVRRALIARASEAGLHINEPGRHPRRPSGVARQTIPPDFLKEVFPSLAKCGPGQYFRAIDGGIRAGNWRPNSPGTALVAALLFSSVSEAFGAFAKAEKRPRATRSAELVANMAEPQRSLRTQRGSGSPSRKSKMTMRSLVLK